MIVEPYKILGYVRTPQGDEVRFVEILDKSKKPKADYVHTVVIRGGIEAQPIQTYTPLKDYR